MSERGWFALDRGWFDHPSFKCEPYTEREAWAWLISEAAFSAHSRRVGSVRVELRRGQVAHSLRYMAEKWDWNEPKVRRFLGRLKTDAMIDLASDAGVTVVTICNFDKYQRKAIDADAASDAQNDAAPTQHRRSTDAKDKKETIKQEADDMLDTRARARAPVEGSPLVPPEAAKLAGVFFDALGIPDPRDRPIQLYEVGHRCAQWHADGWPPDMISTVVRKIMDGRPEPPGIKYFERAFANAFASLNAPAPAGQATEIANGKTQGIDRPGTGLGFSGIAARIRHRSGHPV